MATLTWAALDDADPGAYAHLAADFAATAEDARHARSLLERFGTSLDATVWRGEAADAFRDEIGKLPPKLAKLADSYATASAGMATYGRVLEDLRAQARRLADQAQAADNERRAAEAARDTATATDPAAPTAAYDDAVDRARRRTSTLERELDALRDRRRAAENAAVRALDRAHDLGIKNDPWYKRAWGAVDRWIDDHADILRGFSTGLKWISAAAGLLSFVPILAPICMPIALAAGGAALLMDATLVASGNGSWKSLAVDAALMALPGAGKLATLARAARRAPPGTARAAAQGLRGAANAASKPVTRTLKQVAKENGGKMVGLRHKLKGVDSLERKIDGHAKLFNVSADEAAGTIKDSLRYTMQLPERSLTAGSRTTLARLEDQGYEVVKVKNYWMKGNSYKGVNVELRTPQGHFTELQFHTKRSFDLKMNSHADYEIARDLGQPLELRQQAHDRMVELSDRLEHPPDIGDLGELVRIPRPS